MVVFLQHARDELGALLLVAEIGLVGVYRAFRRDFLLRLGELLRIARNDQHLGACGGDFLGGGQADARRATGDQHHAAAHLALQRAVDLQIGIEIAFPVVPQVRRIGIEPRHCNAAAFQRLLRLAAIEPRRVVDKSHDVVGQAEILHHGVPDAAHRREAHHPLLNAPGDEAQQRGVDE